MGTGEKFKGKTKMIEVYMVGTKLNGGFLAQDGK